MLNAEIMDKVASVLEFVGALVIVGGLVLAVVRGIRSSAAGQARFVLVRRTLGQGILLGLEVLVAADIIRTVAVTPTLESVLVLGIVVLIRTLLSFSLSIEIDGVLPWRRASRQPSVEPEAPAA